VNVGKENEKLEFKKTTAELNEGIISMAAINVSINVSLNEVEQTLLALIKDKPGITWDEAAQSIFKSRRTVQRYFNGLKDKNIIRRVGSKKDGHWKIIAPIGKKPRP
jgi:predicted HTH transcriptional regulator